MCGICGLISSTAVNDNDISAVRQMNQQLEHRGPDSAGLFNTDNIVLAMRRLSIIDLQGGAQPLFNEQGDIALVCNGEIYNHQQLRESLQAKGHVFSSHSDVETIIHAYEEYGVDCLSQLRGMFAFALWDANSQTLLLARDRMGEKPLYLHRDAHNSLWFSSELHSLCSSMPSPGKLSAQAFNLFLSYQYIPEPVTPFDNIVLLPAGHYLQLSSTDTHIEAQAYWDLSQAREDPAEPVKVVEDCLDKACQLMGTADVPVAIALSGGIDSSLVAAITAKFYPHKLHAFTIGYEGRPKTDERDFAAALAKDLKIDFTEVEIKHQEIIDNFPAMIAAMDTPIGDIAAYGYYSVSRAAAKAGFPVLLSGMGGDEFFWGYQWVREAVTRNSAILEGQIEKPSWWQRLLGRKTAEEPDFFGIHADLCHGNSWSRMIMPDKIAQLLPADFWLTQGQLDLSQPMHRAVSELLNRTWLRSNCLALVDRMSMAHSVEVRLPLLDAELVNRVTGMRNAGLQDWSKPHKWLLIEALKDSLPADILSRKKQGFTPPVHIWMKGIVERFSPLIHNGALFRQGLIDAEKITKYRARFDLPFLYKLTLLECWSRIHIEGQKADEF